MAEHLNRPPDEQENAGKPKNESKPGLADKVRNTAFAVVALAGSYLSMDTSRDTDSKAPENTPAHTTRAPDYLSGDKASKPAGSPEPEQEIPEVEHDGPARDNTAESERALQQKAAAEKRGVIEPDS